MELELKHIAPYLPYGLKILRPDNKAVLELVGVVGGSMVFHEEAGDAFGSIGKHNKPLLRPLSQLTTLIKHNGDEFVPMEEIDNYHNFSILRTDDLKTDPLRYPYTVVEALISWHFDVFGLIEAGWAVELNDKTTK
jgi:hypothetical protein